jgi:hypothetical protein
MPKNTLDAQLYAGEGGKYHDYSVESSLWEVPHSLWEIDLGPNFDSVDRPRLYSGDVIGDWGSGIGDWGSGIG